MVTVSIVVKTIFVAVLAGLATGAWGLLTADGVTASAAVQTAETVADLGFVTIF